MLGHDIGQRPLFQEAIVMRIAFRLAGFTLAAAGLLLEGVGVASAAIYPLRRRLPISPFSIQGIGCYCFCGGILLGLAAQFFD
jgi:hypothetical protein